MQISAYSKRGNKVGTVDTYTVSKPGQKYTIYTNFTSSKGGKKNG